VLLLFILNRIIIKIYVFVK
jgi:hypothetical protein